MQIFYRNVLAIETNEYYTRAVLVKTRGRKAKITDWNETIHAKSGSGLLSETHLKSIENTLNKVGRDIENYVVLNFPFSRMIFSLQKMPSLSKDQLLKAISFRISEEINIAPTNLVIDVSFPEGKITPSTDLPVFTVKKEYMDQYLSKIMTLSKGPEPDILLPDNLKYLEIMDQNCFKQIAPNKNYVFLICEDVCYSVLFTFKDGELIQISEIPFSLRYLMQSLEEKGVDKGEIIKAFSKGNEMGSLSHITNSEDLFDDFYRQFVYECEKTISNTITNLGINEKRESINCVMVCSMNKRNTKTIADNLLRSSILRGMRILEMPLKEDYPEDMDSLRGLMGLAYRGVREIGKYKFI